MSNRSKSIILSILMVFVILLMIHAISINFVIGPDIKNNIDTLEIHKKMANKLDAKESFFLSYLTLDEKVYVSQIVSKDGNKLVFYNDNLEILKSIDAKTIDEDSIRNYIEKTYELDRYELRFGIYNDEIIIDIQTVDKEIVLKLDDFAEVFVHKKGGLLDE